MFTFRRALIAAAFILTVLYLISSSHSNPPAATIASKNSQHAAGADKNLSGQDGSATKTGPVHTSPAATSSAEKLTGNSAPSTQQRPLKDMSKAPLIDQLEYQFPYNVETKFLAYIW